MVRHRLASASHVSPPNTPLPAPKRGVFLSPSIRSRGRLAAFGGQSTACFVSSYFSPPSSQPPPSRAGDLPEGFVYLRDTDPTILQDMRYATANNFVGKKVPGYEAPECVLVRQAADALAAVQAELRGKHLTLKVYDCYRPARAVKAFVDWAKLPRRSQSEVRLLSRAGKARLVSGLYRDGLGPFPWRHGRPHPGAARRDRRATPPTWRDPVRRRLGCAPPTAASTWARASTVST